MLIIKFQQLWRYERGNLLKPNKPDGLFYYIKESWVYYYYENSFIGTGDKLTYTMVIHNAVTVHVSIK